MTLWFVKLPNLLKGVSLSVFKWSSCWSKAVLVSLSCMTVCSSSCMEKSV